MFRNGKPLEDLYTSQFLSAFVDNMILFIAIGIIKRDSYPEYYVPLVQATFLFSYIILSPWVGRFADKKPKARVLIIGNIIKACGIIALILNSNPAFSYAVVGVGAVIYSPAKYGILPFLTNGEAELLKANSRLEGFTIIAILSGALAGGYLADRSITAALEICLLFYSLSILFNLRIPLDPGNRAVTYERAITEFWSDTRRLFAIPQSNYSLVGTGSFWLSCAVLRIAMVTWAPLMIGLTSVTEIGMLTAVTGIGIAIGATVTPFLVTIRNFTRTIWFGLVLAACVLLFTVISQLALTVLLMLVIGAAGGIYIVPMNTLLQQIGQDTIGAGKTVAVQNFIENTCMFFGVGAYTLATKSHIGVNVSIGATGAILLLMLGYMYIISRKCVENPKQF